MGKGKTISEGKLYCCICKEDKLESEFSNYFIVTPNISKHCKACRKTINARRKHKNYRKSRKEWESRNPDYMASYGKIYRENNKGYFIAKMRDRHAKKLQASPAWKNDEKIFAFYNLAQELTKQTGQKYHVDHIVPLQGKNVCGLHNEFNLQVIPAKENLEKHNSF